MTKTTTERVADLRRRRSEAGLVRMDVYVYPQDREKVQRYIKRLNERARGK